VFGVGGGVVVGGVVVVVVSVTGRISAVTHAHIRRALQI